MNYLRAVAVAIVTYVVSFFVGIVTAVLLNVDIEGLTQTPTKLWIAGLVSSVILAFLAALWYFRSKTVPNIKNGLLFGLMLLAVSFLLDGLLLIPYVIRDEVPGDVAAYYTSPFFWLIIVLILATTTLTGRILEKRRSL